MPGRILIALAAVVVEALATPQAFGAEAVLNTTAGCANDGHDCAIFRLSADVLPKSGVALANGYFVRAKDWPALAMANFADGIDDQGNPAFVTCTATLVGLRTMLTAAHCIDIGSKTTFRKAFLNVDNQNLELDCDPDPRYFDQPANGHSPRASFDFALCELQWKGKAPVTLQKLTYETVDISIALAKGDEVVLTGYGCTDLRVENHRLTYTPNVGSLRVNSDVISEAVNGSGKDAAYVITRSNSAGDEPALCPGDSGGPLMSGLKLIKPATTGGVATLVQGGDRRVRAVNSSIDFEDRPTAPYDYLSRMAALAGTGFANYASNYWLKRHKAAEICGITSGAKQCNP